jgi:hypothetical protein
MWLAGRLTLAVAVLGVAGVIPSSTGGRYLFIPLFFPAAVVLVVAIRASRAHVQPNERDHEDD